jgi:hypothetical protein
MEKIKKSFSLEGADLVHPSTSASVQKKKSTSASSFL